MKLYYSTTSPYVRKVRVVAREKGLADSIEEILSNPHERPPELQRVNPLGKVPALLLDDGTALYDSPVICEYLDSLNDTVQLIPSDESRWAVLKAQALADGVFDVAVSAVLETRRPANEQSPSAIEHWQNQMRAAVKEMAVQLPALPGELSLGHLSFAVALAYLHFRHPDLEWPSFADPALVSWFDDFKQRPSIQQTAPE